jgi:DNA-binding NtrC family response regulator
VAERDPIILCVDDEEIPLFFRKLVLQKAGFEVLTARSAALALEVLATSKVDLVLSDVLMPNVLGTELARLIKQDHPGMPVVLVSGVNEIPSEAVHADMFISKLEGPVAMCEKIKALLNSVRPTASMPG